MGLIRKLPVLAAFSLIISSCAGSAGGGVLALIQHSADETTEKGSARADIQIEMIGLPGTTDPVEITGEGELDLEEQRSHIVMEMPAISGITLGEIEAIADGTVIYMRMDGLMKTIGAKWVRWDTSEFGQLGRLSSSLQQSQMDPSQSLGYLRGVAEVETVGPEEVRGAETTHYRVTVDLEDALMKAPGGTRERVDAAMRQLRAAGMATKVPMEVWIDADGIAHRLSLEMRMQPPEAERSMTVNMQMELFDFGAPIDIDVPTSGVKDLADLTATSSASTAR